MAHIMRQRQSTSGTTQTDRAHHQRQRTPSNKIGLSHVERRCGHKWTESAEHVCENIWVRHVRSCRNERLNTHVRNNMGSENVEFPWTSPTSFCSVILNHRSSSGQKVSSPNDQNEQSFEVLPDGHIRATEESKIIRNSCRDKCVQCWTNRRQRPDEMDCSTCRLAHSSFPRQ